jgi:hypothetical protein
MRSLEVLSSEARCITTADALILLLDPTQNEIFRNQLPKSAVGARDVEADPITIIDRLINLFERTGTMKLGRMVRKPVAFTLTKIDILEDVLPPDSGLLRHGEHFNSVNMDEIDSIHSELESVVNRWGLLNTIENRFKTYRLFGVSAFGGPPNADGTLDQVSPKRVEDPLLWILSELKIVKKG